MQGMAVSASAQRALSKFLHKLGLLDESHAQADFSSQDFCPIAFYSRAGCFAEEAALKAVSESLAIPFIQLDKVRAAQALALLGDKRLDRIAIERWRDTRLLPLDWSGDTLTVATANPLDHESVKRLSMELGTKVSIALSREDEMLAILAKKVNSIRTMDLAALQSEESETKSEQDRDKETNISSADISAPPVIRIVNKIIAEAVQSRASDIHITPDKNCLNVRIRVDGIMHDQLQVPSNYRGSVTARMKLLANMDIAERRRPQDGRLRVKTGVGIKDLRVSSVPTVFGENIVIRILSSEVSKLPLDATGLSGAQLAMLQRSLKASSRVVLVTGPTGSGKTSTLYAALLHVMDGTTNIITIEDPIEYRISGITQIQVNQKIDVTFAAGLRSILRQDPDIIMVGEIRDGETASIAMQAAQTGHLVLSTLHTNTAAGAVARLIDLGVPAYLVASSLGCVVAQRLVRTLCEACARPLSAEEVQRIAPLLSSNSKPRAAVGCEECGKSGYHGRLGVFSVLDIDEAVRECIRRGDSEAAIEAQARKNGFKTLWESARALLGAGVTSFEELERALGPHTENEPKAEPSPPQGATEAQRLKEQRLDRPRLLLIEDDENTRQVLAMLFEREMFDVIEARDGVEGLELLYDTSPHLIVCDIMMPRMGGFEFLKRMRQDTRTRNIPVLMLTAADTESNEVSSLERGADDFVSKTSDSKIILARIHRLAGRALEAID